MKKLLLTTFFLLLSSQAWATDWYIIPGSAAYGTTSTTCNGSADVAYTTGNGPNCAVGTLYDLLQWTSDDGSTTRGTQRISGGDTIILDDDGTHWAIGADRTTTPANCTSAVAYGCYLKPLPSGSDSAHPTRIVGKNYNTGCATKAQLYGTQGVKHVLVLSGSSHVAIKCVEITDHLSCGFRVGASQCSESYGSDIGTYGRNGIYAYQGTDITLENVAIHGMANEGLLAGGINGLTFDHFTMDGNHLNNWDGDIGEAGSESSFSGTMNVSNFRFSYAGCREAYPPSGSYTDSDYDDCANENAADGAGFYNTAGTWNFINGSFIHNASDGLDLLYCNNANCALNVDKVWFEGNWGNQLKFSAKNASITNSVMIANCKYIYDTSKKYSGSSIDASCRANGTPISATTVLGSNWKFFNNTAITANNSGGSPFIEVVDRYSTLPQVVQA